MAPLTDVESELARLLERLGRRCSYAELMAQTVRGAQLGIDRNQVRPTFDPRVEGVAFRAWTGDHWLETACSGFDLARLRESVETLGERLPAGALGREPPGEPPSGSRERVTEVRRHPADVGLDERLSVARQYFDWGMAVPGITNVVVRLFDTEDERLFLSTSSARRYQKVTRCAVSIVPLAIEGGKVEYDLCVAGESRGFEFYDTITGAQVERTARDSRALLSAKALPTGPMTVLLDPSTSGTFAHESFGHGTEADQILRSRSYLAPLLGQTVGPEGLTLVDDGSYPNGWGTIYFDDEGRPSQRTVLVDKGRFVEVLQDRESASALHRRPTGNARRADFLSRPFVRMTNTFVEPGDWTMEELVQEARDGVLLESCTSGVEDPLGGNMQIKVKKTRRIEHGELTDLGSSMALSGRVLDFLRRIRGVSRRSDFLMSPGSCGKGYTDLLPTGTGGSYLLSEAVVGPA